MFNVYFSGSYFPASWGSQGDPVAPGAMAVFVSGGGAFSAVVRGFASAGIVATGAGSFSGSLEAIQGGQGEMAMTAMGTGTVLASLDTINRAPQDVGSGMGGWITHPRLNTFADFSAVCRGVGSMEAMGAVSSISVMGCLASGSGSLVARPSVTECLEVHGFSLPTFEAVRKAPARVPAMPASVFKPVNYASASCVMSGAGSLAAQAELTKRKEDDFDEIALALLMLMEAA